MSGAATTNRVVVVHGDVDHETVAALTSSGLRVALQLGDTAVWAPSGEVAGSEAEAASAQDRKAHPPLLLTVGEAAAILGIGRTSAYQLIAAGELEVVHVGRSARVPAAAAGELVERLRRGRPSQVSGTLAVRGIAGASQPHAANSRQAS